MIQQIADAVAAGLEVRGLAKLLKPREAVAARVAEAITEDLLAEDRLDRDVEKVLAAHEAEIAQGRMDYRKLFDLTKQKLARERGMIL